MLSHLQCWIPYRKSPIFTGHSALLVVLHERLNQSPLILTGIDGIGKSTLAMEYAHCYQDSYEAIIWLEASSSVSLNAQIMEISIERPALVHNIWIDAKATLLILDNIEDASIVRDFLPSQWGGHLLLTSRFQQSLFPSLILPTLSLEESALLVLRRGNFISHQGGLHEALEADREASTILAQEMGGFPLALDQAGAYLEECGRTPTHYLSLYREHSVKMLGMRGGIPNPIHPESVIMTVEKLVHSLAAPSQELLRLLAVFPSDAIPFYSLFDRKAFDDLVHCFLLHPCDYSKTLFCMQPLVQLIISDQLTKEQRRSYASQVASLTESGPERSIHGKDE